MAKKKTVKKATTGKAMFEFTINEHGELQTNVKYGKKTDERLIKAVKFANDLFLREALRGGNALVEVNGQLHVAKPIAKSY